MTEYIEREEINKAMKEVCDDPSCPMYVAAEIAQIIDCAPAADVAPVVRCKDCKYLVNATVNDNGFLICEISDMEITPDDFCSYGERKDGGADND